MGYLPRAILASKRHIVITFPRNNTRTNRARPAVDKAVPTRLVSAHVQKLLPADRNLVVPLCPPRAGQSPTRMPDVNRPARTPVRVHPRKAGQGKVGDCLIPRREHPLVPCRAPEICVRVPLLGLAPRETRLLGVTTRAVEMRVTGGKERPTARTPCACARVHERSLLVVCVPRGYDRSELSRRAASRAPTRSPRTDDAEVSESGTRTVHTLPPPLRDCSEKNGQATSVSVPATVSFFASLSGHAYPTPHIFKIFPHSTHTTTC